MTLLRKHFENTNHVIRLSCTHHSVVATFHVISLLCCTSFNYEGAKRIAHYKLGALWQLYISYTFLLRIRMYYVKRCKCEATKT